MFGLGLSPTAGGFVDLGATGFPSLTNTLSIIAGTYTFHYYDEVNGPAGITLAAAVGAADTGIAFGQSFVVGTFLQMEQEVAEVSGSNADGSSIVVRGVLGSTASTHVMGVSAYVLTQSTLIVPYIKNFFGSPASGDWQYNVSLPNVRLASTELYMTNAYGPGATTQDCYTNTTDSGLRTLAGGQYSFQITGYLAIQSNAAPPVIVDADGSVRDIYAIVSTAPTGAAITLQITDNGTFYATLQIPDGAMISNVVNGFGMAALRGGDQLNLNISGVGTTTPGSNLTVIMRL